MRPRPGAEGRSRSASTFAEEAATITTTVQVTGGQTVDTEPTTLESANDEITSSNEIGEAVELVEEELLVEEISIDGMCGVY